MRAFLIACLTLALTACGEEAPEPADIVIWGGPIYTGVDSAPQTEAVALRGNLIAATGPRDQIEALVGDETRVIDLGGAALYPGFTDSHMHLLGVGQRELTLNLEGVESIPHLKEVVADRAETEDPGSVIYGRGWIETHWPEERFPTRHDLDEAAPDHSVILTRADGHALVANSRALEAAGITAETEAPFGGEILRDSDGAPTGMLIDAAQGLVMDLIAEPTAEERSEAYVVGGVRTAGMGWTGVHNMSVNPGDVPLIEELSDAFLIPVRVYNAIDPQPGAVADLFENGPKRSAEGRAVTRTIKLYMDGALGSRGAALLEPYADADTSGLLMTTKEETMPTLEGALRSGIQIAMHAIGDRGNRLLLDWFEEAFQNVPAAERRIAEPRWRDEHTQIVHPDDLPRFAELGVIPSMQPSHAIGDLFFAPDRLGAERLTGAYAWKSLIETGVPIAAGSDAPVEKGDPRIEFYAAVARRALDGFADENWHLEESVSRENALKMFTIWPAVASFREDELGTIEEGKIADLTGFSADIMVIPAEEILTVEPVLTIVDGRIAHENF